MPTRRLAVSGALAQKPGFGGHTWALLQYVLGFKQMGWDVLFLDQLDSGTCTDASGRPCAVDDSTQLRYFLDVMARFHSDGEFTLVCDGERFLGLSREQTIGRLGESAFLLNIMGFLKGDLLRAAGTRVFLDIDPGFGQMWRELGLHDPFEGHNAYVTIGERIGQPDCAIPNCGIDWITTRPPVVLAHWPACPIAERGTFTSIASWRGAYGPVEYRGQTYGLRAHEFRKFVALPRLTGRSFELALDIHPDEGRDRELLDANGWVVVNPRTVAADPETYRSYIQRSGAEYCVAKNMYVRTNCGWISDRSLCYLASGRPALAEETGFSARYPTGQGLVSFRTLDDAVGGVESICGDYPRHAKAARALVEEYFDSTTVLGRLLDKLGVS